MADWEQGLKGAAGGAMAGSAFGPIGTAVGAGVGGLAGLFGGGESEDQKRQRQMLQDYYNQVGGRAAPQMGPAAQAGYSSFRGNQAELVSRLEALSKGQGPSLAAQQFQQATDRNMAAQQSMAQSGRGGPLAAFNAANNMGQLGAQAAQGVAMARTNEQMQAMNQLGLTIHGARGADESLGQFNAGQQNQASMQNLDARLRAMGMNDQTRLQILQQLGGQNQAQAQQPGMGDQFLAGGAGMMSFMSAQNAAKKAASGGGSLQSLAQQYPHGGGTQGFITKPSQMA